MCKKYKIGVIGAGFMASSIIKGVLNAKILNPSEIIVSDLNDSSLQKVSNFGVAVTKDNFYLANNSDFVLFAVKPQNLTAVLSEIKGATVNKFISIMAGVKKQKIKEIFNSSLVCRCMPNTPCAIGFGVIGADITDFTNENDVCFVKSFLEAISKVVYVNEDKLNAVTGVSGSGPAYFYLFLKGIIDAGVKNGLTYEDSKILALNTMIGAGKMVENNFNKDINELITAVCSKGGTTIEAIKVYNDNYLSEISEKAVDACVKRASELENTL